MTKTVIKMKTKIIKIKTFINIRLIIEVNNK